MTVRELRELLMKYPDEARVFEDSKSELRELNPDDVMFDESAEGNPIDEAEYDEVEWEELQQLPIIVFGAWS